VTIDHFSGVPLYIQLADLLRAAITSGEYAGGTFLPSLKQLTEQHEVSRMTAERAVERLRSEGLVRGIPGKGVYVLPEADRGTR
jgi:DNA-binding GntR family transcriptional regulator